MSLFVGASESYDTDVWEAYSLKKENAKLRQQLADVTESMGRVEERCAKLRELCADFYKFSDSMCTQFNDCSHCLFMGEDGVNCKYLELFQRICKLRIEVES